MNRLIPKPFRLAIYCGILVLGLIFLSVNPTHAQVVPGTVHILEIEGVINPPIENYIQRTIRAAQEQNASLIIITMDTPGGLDTSMRQIAQMMLSSSVPVAVYVYPSGARAASAGLFLLTAAHIAAMAPGTNTGAASPVGLGGDADDVSMTKAVEDAAAFIRTMAMQHDRNAEWVERAVREAVSVTEREALELNVIDIVAESIDDLIVQVHGQTFRTAAGEVTLDVANAPHHEASMNFAENFLHVISDPNIAFILLSVGSIGIIAELYNPGTFFPGIFGAISLILAFFSLGNLPTNWAGVALLALGIGLFIAELYVEGFGPLGVGALVSFALGGLMLFQPFRPAPPAWPDLSVNPWLVGSATAIMSGFMFLVMAQLVRSRKAPIKTGHEQFIGQIVTVKQDLNPEGRVWFQGQNWYAKVNQPDLVVEAGKKVRIIGIESLTLITEPVEVDQNPQIN
ncbi:MAG: nodulation protein NfeD [Anaerolineales bacterium]|nr:nodulation protein NfeD [Anaerolineales bacterium]